MTTRELTKRLKADGWIEVRQSGSHRMFQHPTKPGTVPVPDHRGDLGYGLVKAILKQAGLK